MNKKSRFLAVALTVLTALSFGSCDVKTKIEQLRCEHLMDEGKIVVEATCEDVGEKLLTCTLCGYEECEFIPATGHIFVNVDAEEPTCTEVGYMEGAGCILCYEWLVIPFEIPANGHNVVTVAGKEPTCTETGLTDGSICTVCGEQVIRQEELPANGHNVVTVAGKAPTCSELGYSDEKYCTTCNEILERAVHISRIPCLDEDADGFCDMCKVVIPLKAGTYTEVKAEVGETVVGNWYRIYYSEETTYYLKLSSKVLLPDFGYSAPVPIYFFYSWGVKGCSIDGSLMVAFNDNNSIADIFYYEEYMDIYIKAGTLKQGDVNGSYNLDASEAVTEETTIASVADINVYRLVPND